MRMTKDAAAKSAKRAKVKAALRAELERLAASGQTLTHLEIAKIVGLASHGLNELLDGMRAEEMAFGRPDLGCLVVARTTGFPRYVGTGKADREYALSMRKAVFAAYGWKG